MNTRVRRLALAIGAATFLTAAVASPRPIDSYPQTYGVKQLDLGFTLGGGAFKARVILVTGEGLDVPLETDADTQALLRVAQIASGGNVAVTATVAGRRVMSLQCTVKPSLQ